VPATKRGIYHSLKESEYTVTNGELFLFFSSQLYMHKFLEGFKANRETVDRLTRKVLGEHLLNMETIADVSFYRSIEKRGFRARLKGIDITWKDIHQYALRKMIGKNTPDWREMLRIKSGEPKRNSG
jgi:hypothetical protein